MEEVFFTGYCRALDQSRIVEAEMEDGALQYVDCGFGGCPYEDNCPIAHQLREAAQRGQASC